VAASCRSVGTSAVKMENRNCDRSEPWGTLAVILHYDNLISAIVALKVLLVLSYIVLVLAG
jgi:hypothetical protein